MRKGVGLGALMGTTQQQTQFQSHGTSIRNTHLDELTTQFEVFRASLAHFAQSHAKDIRSNPSFRAEFARMCQVIGVDPLASSSGKKGSFWAEMLGGSVGDFYFELAVRVVEVCRASREENGGLIEVKDVKRRIEERQESVGGGIEIAEDDIVRSVEALKPLGGGFSIVEIGKRRFIRSVPKELSSDQFVVIEAAQVGLIGIVWKWS